MQGIDQVSFGAGCQGFGDCSCGQEVPAREASHFSKQVYHAADGRKDGIVLTYLNRRRLRHFDLKKDDQAADSSRCLDGGTPGIILSKTGLDTTAHACPDRLKIS